MSSNRGPGRPQGGRSIKPTKKEIRSYLELLRERAESGDVHAAGWLVQLHTAEQHHLKEREA